MNDMCLIGHVLGGHERALDYIVKALNKQTKINKRTAILGLVTTIWVVTAEIRIVEANAKISVLDKKIEGLKEGQKGD